MSGSRSKKSVNRHAAVIQVMAAYGYPYDEGGVCYGLANMALQAMAADDLKTFSDRLDKIQEIMNDFCKECDDKAFQYMHDKFKIDKANMDDWTPEQIERFDDKFDEFAESKEDLKNICEEVIGKLGSSNEALDLAAFLDGVALYFDPSDFKEMLGPEERQGSDLVMPIVTPENIRETGIHKYDAAFIGCTDLCDLESILSKILLTAWSSSGNLNTPLQLLVSNMDHAIMIGFDPRNKKSPWVFFDPSDKKKSPIKSTSSREDMAEWIMRAFGQKDPDQFVTIGMQLFSLKSKEYPEIQTRAKIAESDWVDSLTQEELSRVDNFGCNILHAAAKDRNSGAYVEKYLAAGLDPSVKNIKSRIPLQGAVIRNNFSIVKKLIDVSKKEDLLTVLDSAIILKKIEVLKILFDNSILQKAITNNQFKQILHLAIEYNDIALMNLALKQKPKIGIETTSKIIMHLEAMRVEPVSPQASTPKTSDIESGEDYVTRISRLSAKLQQHVLNQEQTLENAEAIQKILNLPEDKRLEAVLGPDKIIGLDISIQIALSSDGGIIALHEKLMTLEQAIVIGIRNLQVLLQLEGIIAMREGFFSLIKPEQIATLNPVSLASLLTDNGKIVLREKLINFEQIFSLHPSTLLNILCDNGIILLREKLMSIEQISPLHHETLKALLTDNGVIALREKLIAPEMLIDFNPYDVDELVDEKVLEFKNKSSLR